MQCEILNVTLLENCFPLHTVLVIQWCGEGSSDQSLDENFSDRQKFYNEIQNIGVRVGGGGLLILLALVDQGMGADNRCLFVSYFILFVKCPFFGVG